jgi:agmatine deiminase
MMIPSKNPSADGFHMPAEFSEHDGTIIIWPVRPGSWGVNPENAQKAFSSVIKNIAIAEKVIVIAEPGSKAAVEEALRRNITSSISAEPATESLPSAKNASATESSSSAKNALTDGNALPVRDGSETGNILKNISVLEIPTDDSWARDTAPTFITNGSEVRGVSWQFNAWGGEFDGLYAHWDKDNALAEKLCNRLDIPYYDFGDFVLEGGSIHTDGEGTLITTESCLLSKGRNPSLTREDIEDRLKKALGIKKVLWLPRGIYNDETNEHVDNVCAFIAPGEVVLAWTDNENDPQYELSRKDLEYLENVTDAKGRKIKVHKLPIPDHPILIDESELSEYSFEEGEDTREIGERLAASYVNFYFANSCILVPSFGGENTESDKRAISILKALLPDKKVIGIDALAILLGGGNIHCITQQLPKGGLK